MRFWQKYPTQNESATTSSHRLFVEQGTSRLPRDPHRLPDCVRTTPATPAPRCSSARVRRVNHSVRGTESLYRELADRYQKERFSSERLSSSNKYPSDRHASTSEDDVDDAHDDPFHYSFLPRTPYNSPKCSVVDDTEFIDLLNIY